MWLKLLLLIIASTAMAEEVTDLSLPGCLDKCGNVSIPYPFGIGEKCSRPSMSWFNLTCENTTLYIGKMKCSDISFQGQMNVWMPVASKCYNESGALADSQNPQANYLEMGTSFTISSTENKFINVGCDTYGYLYGVMKKTQFSTGCLTRCPEFPTVDAGNCLGVGCCHVDIPSQMRNIKFEAFSFNNHTNVSKFNNCSYAFVAKKGWYNFSLDHLKRLPDKEVPVVLNWTVSIVACDVAEGTQDYACTNNTDCVNSSDGVGYNCRCIEGFDGNPYHPHGCHDIDECQHHTMNNCNSREICVNSPGSFQCKPNPSVVTDDEKRIRLYKWIFIGTCVALVALVVSISLLYLKNQKRSKENFFRQNGGLILKELLSVKEISSQTAKIFTTEELKKATNNYHNSSIIGRGGYGIVYQGTLTDNRVVAIKKSKQVNQSQIEQFINEVVILSQINHKNVVKLLGCCLETKIPLLVYEFVNNGTLYDHIHDDEGKYPLISWKRRLKIAAETAKALSHMHSNASIPIIHRDVKSSNILLDDSYTAKVSDFGAASRLVPRDEAELARIVQGTLGYLDPEYFQTSEFTDKSDVYSFGVVLLELLTGKSALSFDRPKEEMSLAMYFLSSMKKGQLFEVHEKIDIANNENNDEMLKEVASLAEKCLRVRGDERPTMEEVATELEGIRITRRHSWVNNDNDSDEVQPLLPGETSGIRESGDSINYRNTQDSGGYRITEQELIDLNGGR